MEDTLNSFRDYANASAALRRLAEQHYYDTNGDYTLCTIADEFTRLGMRLERIVLSSARATPQGDT